MKVLILLFSFVFISFATAKPLGLSDVTPETDQSSSITPTQHATPKTLNKKAYIVGGFASIFLGFGIGHIIQGRWWDEGGWVFTLGEAVTGSVILTSLFKTTPPKSDHEMMLRDIHNLVSYTSMALFIALRVWASVDTWVLPSHIKIAQESRFQITPLVVSNYSNSHNLSLGLNMKYRF